MRQLLRHYLCLSCNKLKSIIVIKMKRILTLALILAVTNIPMSCDECGPYITSETTILELNVTNGTYDQNGFSDINSSDFSQAAINVFILESETKRITASLQENSFSFIAQAYACEAPLPVVNQKLISI